MWHDPIVEEVRKVREAHAAEFNYDLEAIVADLKEKERKSGRTYVRLAPRRVDADEPELVAAHTENARSGNVGHE